jgi:hypothetical protein
MANIRPLTRELSKKAASELNEIPERIQGDLNTIREWLKKCPHITPCTDDQFLVAFLRGCEYRLELVKEKLDLFYTVRSALPQMLQNRDPSDGKIKEILRLG